MIPKPLSTSPTNVTLNSKSSSPLPDVRIEKNLKELFNSLVITDCSIMPDKIFNNPNTRAKYEYK